MLFNAEKSEHLAISTRKSDNTSPRVTMNGTPIQHVTSHKHQGVHFNNTLSWHQHVHKVYTSCARRIGMIWRLRRKLHPVVLKRIYYPGQKNWDRYARQTIGSCMLKRSRACARWRVAVPIFLARVVLGSSTAKIGIRMPSVVWWTSTEAN